MSGYEVVAALTSQTDSATGLLSGASDLSPSVTGSPTKPQAAEAVVTVTGTGAATVGVPLPLGGTHFDKVLAVFVGIVVGVFAI